MKRVCKNCKSQILWSSVQLWHAIDNEYYYRCDQCAYKCDKCNINPATISYNVLYKLGGLAFDKTFHRCKDHVIFDYKSLETEVYRPKYAKAKVYPVEIFLVTVIAKVVTHEEEQVYSVMAE